MDLTNSYDLLKLCNKICKGADGCNDCCLHEKYECAYSLLRASENFNSDYKRLIEALEQYNEDHHQKTYLEDFKERFPNAKLRKDGTPNFCINKYREMFGLKRNGCVCACKRHWNQVMDE